MFENLYAMIENTTLCGANCIMCPRDKFNYKFENMPLSTFKKIIDELVAQQKKVLPSKTSKAYGKLYSKKKIN